MFGGGVFDVFYRDYDEWYRRNWEVFESEVKALESLGLHGRGLDVGVGTGVFASRLGIEFGVDLALNPLKLSMERGVEVLAADGAHLPFRERCFDYVVITISVCFFEKPVDVFGEVARVLKTGGSLAVCIVPRDSPWGRYYEELGKRGHRFYRYARFYTLNELREMIESAGFEVERIKATLSYSPSEEKRVEEPTETVEGRSFICVKAVLR